MRMWSMREGDVVDILGGDPENNDALSWDEHYTLFNNIRNMLGVNFRLEKNTALYFISLNNLTR